MFGQLSEHEGVRPGVYNDSLGNPTIGIGFNLADSKNQEYLAKSGIDRQALLSGKQQLNDAQMKQLYRKSFANAYRDSLAFLPDLDSHPEPVQRAVVDMAYNMGASKLMGFQKARAAFMKRDYGTASNEMMDSLWAKQVKGRAVNLSKMVREAGGVGPSPGTGNHPLNR